MDMRKAVKGSDKWIPVIQLLNEFRLDIVSGILVPDGVIVKNLIRDIILCSCLVDKYTILIFFTCTCVFDAAMMAVHAPKLS